MGTRERDDFANRLDAISQEVPGIDLCLGGHTHRRVIGKLANGTPYGQANYYGIDCGRAVLKWDADQRRVTDCSIEMIRMDSSIEQDAGVLSLCAEDLASSATLLAKPAGVLKRRYQVRSSPGTPSDVEELIAGAIVSAMKARGVSCDGVFHGLFDTEHALEAGPKTVGDWWRVIPFENEVVTAELTPEQMWAILTENFETGQGRNLMGFRVIVEAVDGRRAKLVDLLAGDGDQLQRNKRYRIALNSYDGQSAGQRLSRLAAILREPAVNNTLHPVQTREALITFAGRV
jgi:2',3'-cyclic-nucleotide 2'-phosphodiesterase (5'-nucleotidase family)